MSDITEKINKVADQLNDISEKYNGLDEQYMSKSAAEDFTKKFTDKLAEMDALKAELEEVKAEKTSKPNRVWGTEKKAEGFFNWLVSGPLSHKAEVANKYQDIIKATPLNSATDADGKHLVPEEFANEFLKLVPSYAVWRQYFPVVDLPVGGSLEWPKESANASDARFTNTEGEAMTESNYVFTNVVITPKEMSAFLRSSNKLVFQSRISLAEIVGQGLAEKMGLREDYAVGLADGTADENNGGITGLKSASGVADVTVASLSALDYDDLLDMQDAAHESIPNMADAAYFMHRKVWTAVKKLKVNSESNHYPYDIIDGVRQRSIDGYPVHLVNNGLEDGTSPATGGELICVFGSPSRAGRIVQGRNLALSATTERYWERNQIGWKMVQDFGFGVTNTNAMSRIVVTS